MQLRIRTYGDPVLRAKAEAIEDIGPETAKLARDMIETMHAENGVGLAAQQVGLTQSICVLDVPASYDMDAAGRRLNPDVEMPLVLINPRIESMSPNEVSGEEGCLSFPDLSAAVSRADSIVLTYQDTKGRPHKVELSGFFARAVQHEYDHLNGVLLVDRMSPLRKVAVSGKLKRLKRETQERLGMTD